MHNLRIIIVLLVVTMIFGACAPTPTQDLPTLVRFPEDGETITPDVSLADASSLRTPLPASFTPTFTPTTTPTFDPSVTATLTPTISVTPSATITNTATATPTDPPPLLPEDRPILAFALTAAAATVLPQDYQIPNFGGADVTLIPQATATFDPSLPSPIPPLATSGVPLTTTCSTIPTGGFGTLFQGNPDIANQLGCPLGAVQNIPAAWQNYQTGIMVWLNGEILVFYSVSDTYQSLPDTFIEGVDPETTSETPPSSLIAPIRGFLKVWNGNSAVRNGLGWATNNESGTTATVQNFNNGRMIFIPGRTDVLILIGAQSGTWLAFQGSY